MNKKMIQLLLNFLKGKASIKDFYKLRDNINSVNNDDLYTVLEYCWEEESNNGIMPDDSKSLIFSKLMRHTEKQSAFAVYKMIAAIFVPLLIGLLTFLYSQEDQFSQMGNFIMTTDIGQKSNIILPDGSTVWLNSNSKLVCAQQSENNLRIVSLEGEGYFKIAKQKHDKFVVKANGLNIVVLGTEFYVNTTNSCDDVEVVLVNGLVSVEAASLKQNYEINPGDHLVYNKSKKSIRVEKQETEFIGLWRHKKLVFEDALAQEVYHKIAYWYGVKIHMSKAPANFRYGFTLRNETITELLDLINELTPIEYTIDGKEVYVSYK